METEVEQSSMDRKYFEIEKKEFLIENDHLLEQINSQDIVCTDIYSYDDLVKYDDMEKSFIDEYNKYLELEPELLKKKYMAEKEVYNEPSKRFSILEKHCISFKNECVNHIPLENEWSPLGGCCSNTAPKKGFMHFHQRIQNRCGLNGEIIYTKATKNGLNEGEAATKIKEINLPTR
ncbi:hypothetical protein Tco_0483679 [Tanacetum coccineum]